VDLRAIEYFAAVAEGGTVRGAAARLGISQPALTEAIRRLEDEVGVVLFDRQARGVTLTAYGRTLLRHARNLQASLKEAREEIAALRAGIAGRVRARRGSGSCCRRPSPALRAGSLESRSMCWVGR